MATDLKIDTSNPNAITYCTEELALTILGGIRMDGLDRLRVTIRIEVVNRKFEHYMNNADLAALPFVGWALLAKDFTTEVAIPMSNGNAAYTESNRRSGNWIANLPH